MADELTTPAPVFQLERNQLDLSQELTDGEMNPASAELMETAELKEVCPLVDGQLDTAEDYVHQTAGNIPAQATGSSGAQAIGNIPGQTTGSSEAQVTGNFEARTAESSEVATTGSFGGQDTGSPEVQIAEGSEVATTVSPVERASAQAVVYPNSGSVNPTIIIENNNRQFTVMNSDATEEPGSLERGSQGATVTTGVAGAEQMTRARHQYTKISGTHV